MTWYSVDMSGARPNSLLHLHLVCDAQNTLHILTQQNHSTCRFYLSLKIYRREIVLRILFCITFISFNCVVGSQGPQSATIRQHRSENRREYKHLVGYHWTKRYETFVGFVDGESDAFTEELCFAFSRKKLPGS